MSCKQIEKYFGLARRLKSFQNFGIFHRVKYAQALKLKRQFVNVL